MLLHEVDDPWPKQTFMATSSTDCFLAPVKAEYVRSLSEGSFSTNQVSQLKDDLQGFAENGIYAAQMSIPSHFTQSSSNCLS